MPRLTKRLIDSLRPRETHLYVFDSDLTGFGVRVVRSGLVSFIVQYRAKPGGPMRRLTLGRFGLLTVDQARRKALQVLAEAGQGVDPAAKREREAATVADLGDRYMAEHAEPRKKPRSVAEDRRLLDKWVLPALGRRMVFEISRENVRRLHNRMKATPVQANRVLALLGKMFALAEEWGLRSDGSNPTRHLKPFSEQKRQRFLSQAELARLGQELAKEEAEARTATREAIARQRLSAVAVIRLLVLSGCRLGEVLSLRWSYVDTERRIIAFPDSKTGQKVIPINAPTLEVLDRLDRTESDYVFPGEKPETFREEPRRVWRRVRKNAALEDVRLHDLRHSFASVAVGGGVSLYVLGGLLGHRQSATTARYAHLADDPLRQASELTGARVEAALEGKPDAKVIPIREA